MFDGQFFIQQPQFELCRRRGTDNASEGNALLARQCHKIRAAECKGLTTFHGEGERERERESNASRRPRALLTPNRSATRSCTPVALHAMQPPGGSGGGSGGGIDRARFFVSDIKISIPLS